MRRNLSCSCSCCFILAQITRLLYKDLKIIKTFEHNCVYLDSQRPDQPYYIASIQAFKMFSRLKKGILRSVKERSRVTLNRTDCR
ncbi:hypothetical protein T12_6663 [Trichinella patagoniensis]|uniref:Uncharacterized protein n=1 Tax=Trichinella patagoniensis TaxID=990121 RepID=A0A0V0ZSR3_9BILA|nr:hypothetical protein T12_6663 [Trichinella patagoniensis]